MKKILTLIMLVFFQAATMSFADTGIGESESGFLTSMPPGIPELKVPADNATSLPVATELAWHSLIHTRSYNLQVSDAADFSNLIVNVADLTDTTFSLTGLENNTIYYWRVSAVNVAGESDFSAAWHFTTLTQSSIDHENRDVPTEFALRSVYPNPFNPTATVTYDLPKEAEVNVSVYNSMGQLVKVLISEHQTAGQYSVQWHTNNNRGGPVTSGLYLCRFEADGHVFLPKR